MLGSRRLFAVLGLSVALAWLGAVAVKAAGNEGTPIPPPPTLHGEFCGDLGLITVSAEVDSWNLTMKVFTSRDGTVTQLFTGHQRAIIQGNGKTLTFDTSGPGRFTIFTDGTVTFTGTGHLLYIGPPGTPQPGIFLYSGTNVIDISDPTNATVSGFTGNKRDICAMLAA